MFYLSCMVTTKSIPQKDTCKKKRKKSKHINIEKIFKLQGKTVRENMAKNTTIL